MKGENPTYVIALKQNTFTLVGIQTFTGLFLLNLV